MVKDGLRAVGELLPRMRLKTVRYVGSRSCYVVFFFSSRRRHTRLQGDWSSDVCSSDLVGIVVQAYLRDAEDDLLDLLEWARQRGTRFGIRLVKGAYWDFERIKSRQNG